MNLVVEHNTFNFSVVNVPANAPVVINFVNKDNIPHNFAVYQNANASLPVFVGEAINGPGSGTYQFVTPSVGLYYFRSDADNTVRAGMFVVQ